MSAQHTAGPWRWEINTKSKSLHLVGGVRTYDLTIMEPIRWGMHGAGLSFRDTAFDGMNIMHNLHERSDWVAPFTGRDHHASWRANIIHPDARLMAAAPDLLEALVAMVDCVTGVDQMSAVNEARAAIAKATGIR